MKFMILVQSNPDLEARLDAMNYSLLELPSTEETVAWVKR